MTYPPDPAYAGYGMRCTKNRDYDLPGLYLVVLPADWLDMPGKHDI
jgi:hypothetical protein